MLKSADYVVERHPAHVLFARPDLAANTHLKGQQHFAEGAALAAQHDAEAHMHNADACARRDFGGCFPVATYVSEKTSSRLQTLVQHFIAAIAIPSNRRRAD